MEEIIGIILNNWTGLKMSIEHGMGGNNNLVSEKLECMIKIITDSLNQANCSWENVSDELEEIMDVEFNTILEDGSTDEVAQKIYGLFQLWQSGNQNEINLKLSELPVKVAIQNSYQLEHSQTKPQRQKLQYENDTAGNSYVVEENSEESWTEVRRKR